eukprot:gnl/TRDRNA2_/TRDRNA2_187629_c0_seq1.p1 gnl/TRDRNA2_/TRDRNA2_187629_c0~~gnl/TRDRNA2_/TRDRNA2_187629_c0_seq1.p1  ORF type:complete len:321 (-),score=38.82 gnl/TRDRNA2_/TRDRNA2_187629_c0_seq1:106-1068(-)
MAATEEEVARQREDGVGSGSSSELEDHMSQQLICPISHRVMELPMITPSGHTYDHESITAWLGRRAVDPLCGRPLTVSSLYPNRALQDEVAAQLERLAADADSRGEQRLADAARAKLVRVTAARPEALGGVQAGRLDKLADSFACCAAWWGILAWEQALVFTTSFGALGCLLVDALESTRNRPWVGKLWVARAPLGRAVGRGANEARPSPQLLTTFLRLAMLPSLAPPKHWQWMSWLTVQALRCSLILPVMPTCLCLALGGLASLARFSQRCTEVQAAERERAARSHWFMGTLHVCNSIAGFSSFGLFLRLYWDFRHSNG